MEYQYDGLGRRIGKSVDENGDGFMDRTQTFIYDGAGLLAASGGSIQISGPNGLLNQHGWVDDLVLVFEDGDGDGSGGSVLSSRLLHGPAIDQVFAMESASGDVLWSLTDHQGTVRDWVESADFDSNSTTETEVINHLNFDAFGNLQSVTDNTGQPTSLDSRLSILPAYTGQLYDADAGLHYYKARWYDSTIGKFTSEDPMGFEAGDANVSMYVGNDSPRTTDATGLDGRIKEDPSHFKFEMDIWHAASGSAPEPYVLIVDFDGPGYENKREALSGTWRSRVGVSVRPGTLPQRGSVPGICRETPEGKRNTVDFIELLTGEEIYELVDHAIDVYEKGDGMAPYYPVPNLPPWLEHWEHFYPTEADCVLFSEACRQYYAGQLPNPTEKPWFGNGGHRLDPASAPYGPIIFGK